MVVSSWESEVIKRLDAIAGLGGITVGGGGTSGGATASNQEQLLASFSQFLGENATEAKQDETIALLAQLIQQLNFSNGVGAVQPSQVTNATTTVLEILPASGTRKRARITNHSDSDFILIDLNGDATSTKGQIIGAGQTWESPSRAEARSRITVISGTVNDVPISYQETFDSVFSIGNQTIISQNLNIIDLRYPISIVGATAPLTSMSVELFEVGTVTAISTNNYNTGLTPGATINADFIGIDGFNGVEPKEFYIVVSEG